MLEFKLLGTVEARGPDGLVKLGSRRLERLMLGLLLIEVGRIVPVSRLADLMWEADQPLRPARVLQMHASRLRACLDPWRDGRLGVRISATGDGFAIHTNPDSVDVIRFRSLVEQAGRTSSAGDRISGLREALALWRGPLLADAATDRQRDRIGAGLAEMRWHAQEMLLETRIAKGEHESVIGELTDLVAAEPWRERLVAALMLALYHNGQQTDALALYRRTRERLDAEVGVEPGPQLQVLQHQILTRDPALRKAFGQIAPSWSLPSATHRFVGRCEALADLDKLTQRSPNQPLIITGISGGGGIGKTTLALRWGGLNQDKFPDGQLYINLRGYDGRRPLSSHDALRILLSGLGVRNQDIPPDEDSAANLYRSMMATRQTLVLLDNALDEAQVRPLLAAGCPSTVLITSRDGLSGLIAKDGAQAVPLSPLCETESAELLAMMLGPERAAAAPVAVADIAMFCGRLPLALAVLGARLARQPEVSLDAFAGELRLAGNPLNALAGSDPATNLRVVFSWSYEKLHPQTASLFRLLGEHPGPDISVPAAASLAGVAVGLARKLLDELVEANLILENHPGRFGLHDLVRAFAAETCRTVSSEPERKAAVKRLFDFYVATAHEAAMLLTPHRRFDFLPGATSGQPMATQGEALTWLSAEHAGLTGLISAAAGDFDEQVCKLVILLADHFDRNAQWQDWINTHEAGLRAAERLGDLAMQANCHRHLARAHVRHGNYLAAHDHYRAALELTIEIADSTTQAHVHLGIATLLEHERRWDEAIVHATMALEIYETLKRDTGRASAMNSIGWFNAHNGNHTAAIDYCSSAIALNQRTGEARAEALAWHSLGFAHHQASDHVQAIACYTKARAMMQHQGHRHYEALILQSICDVHIGQHSLCEARKVLEEALAILEDLGLAQAEQVRARLASVFR